MLQQARLWFVALQFMTRVPVPRWVGFDPAWLNASARYFPTVGTLVGCVAALVLWLSGQVFPAVVGAVLSIAITLLLTGAFHEDGLADTFDALGGQVDRERALEIMKDSRIGTYGTAALVVVLGLKATTLASLPLEIAMAASIVAHTMSRAMPVLLIRWLSYAGNLANAKAKPMAERVTNTEVVVALAWVATVCAVIAFGASRDGIAIVVGLAMAAFATGLCARWFRKRLGGHTGDTLGALQQIVEVLVLLSWLACTRWAS